MAYGTKTPPVVWSGSLGLRSQQFGDIYFPSQNAVEVVRHVFCRPNRIPEVWHEQRKLRQNFVIGELGFGTGLNFFVTAALWKEYARSGQRLHFVSCEKYPLEVETVQRILSPYSLPSSLLNEFYEQYPPPLRGFHRLHFSHGITLDLLFGDACEVFKEMHGTVDAWYLDGFSPSKNAELWSSELFRLLAQHSKEGTTLSTFSSAGSVRRALESVGFKVQKFPGYGGKRESLCGVMCEGCRAVPISHRLPSHPIIIGGGLAGTAVAGALTRRGVPVTLLEREQELASRASGNPLGVLLPYLRAKPDAVTNLYLSGFLYSLRIAAAYRKQGLLPSFETPGIVHFPSTERLKKLLDRLTEVGIPTPLARYLSPAEATEFLGAEIRSQAFNYPLGAQLSPPEFCKAMVAQQGVTLSFRSEAISISYHDGEWAVSDDAGKVLTVGDALVIANAHEARNFELISWLPLEAVRGQLLQISPTNSSSRVKPILCYDGYLLPARDGKHLMGTTYNHFSSSTKPEIEQNRKMISRLRAWVPELNLVEQDIVSTRVSFRTSTYDRFPFVGPVSNSCDGPIPFNNLYLTVGFGSRGLVSAPLSGELVAAQICGEILPVPNSVLLALDPERYLRSRAVRQQRVSGD